MTHDKNSKRYSDEGTLLSKIEHLEIDLGMERGWMKESSAMSSFTLVPLRPINGAGQGNEHNAHNKLEFESLYDNTESHIENMSMFTSFLRMVTDHGRDLRAGPQGE